MANDVVRVIEYGTRELLASYRSKVCPMCGGTKAKKRSMCGGCYSLLCPALKSACYKRFREGYEEAIRDSADFLGVSALCLPADVSRRRGAVDEDGVGTDPAEAGRPGPDVMRGVLGLDADVLEREVKGGA